MIQKRTLSDLDTFHMKLKTFLEIAENHADHELSKLRSKADKKVKDVDKRLENLNQDSAEFKENITEDSNVMDKYSQNIYDQIQITLTNVQRYEKASLRNLNLYISSIRDGLSEQDKVLIKYVKLLKDRKYKKRVQTLSKSLQRLNKDLKGLEDFVKQDYAPSASVEEASSVVLETIDLIKSYEENFGELLKHESDVLNKKNEVDRIQEELKQLKGHPILEKYENAIHNYKEIQREVDYAFSHIRKVFRKYDKFTSKNRKSTNNELLSELVTDAASALAKQPSISSVETLLIEIDESLKDNALNLARDKRENAEADIKSFLDGKLDEYYVRAKEIVNEKEFLAQELRNLELDNKIEHTERELVATERDMVRIYQRRLRILQDLSDQIAKNVSSINKYQLMMSSDSTDIKGTLPDYPNWVESDHL